jgi:hypothetical protein
MIKILKKIISNIINKFICELQEFFAVPLGSVSKTFSFFILLNLILSFWMVFYSNLIMYAYIKPVARVVIGLNLIYYLFKL